MPETELCDGTTQGRARGALSERWRGFARRKRIAGDFESGTRQGAPQVVLGGGMTARELRTNEAPPQTDEVY